MPLRVYYQILDQKGTPAFYTDVFANRPAYGFNGRVFISTDTGQIFEDTGTSWSLIADAGVGGGTLASVTANGNTTTTGIVLNTTGATGAALSLQNSGSTKWIVRNNSTSGNNIFEIRNEADTITRLSIANGLNGDLTFVGGNIIAARVDSVNDSSIQATNTSAGLSASATLLAQSNSGIIKLGKYSTTNNIVSGIFAASDAYLINSSAGDIGVFNSYGSGNIKWAAGGSSTAQMYLTSTGVLMVGSTTANASWTGTKFYAGLSSPAESHIYNIGVTGTALANSGNANIWGVGVYGAGYTNGATRAAGVQGDGEVNASGDTGSAIGVRGYATATHSGGLNIGILGDASGSSTGNYGLYTNMASAANTYALYNLGTAASYFGGNVSAGNTTSGSQINVYASSYGNNGLFNAYGTDNAIKLQMGALGATEGYLYTGASNKMTFYSGGALALTLASNQAATFSSSVDTGGNITITKTTPGLILNGTNSGNSGAYINLQGWASSNKNWQLSVATTGASGLELITSTAAGGTSFGTVVGRFSDSTGIYTPVSDINKKKDFEISTIGLKEVLQLKPTLYRMKSDDELSSKELGFLAQEVKEFIPQSYVESGNEDNKFIGLNFNAITTANTKAIQELYAKILQLEEQVLNLSIK